ncbi:BAH domain, partial [Musa troglodytarum]
MTYQKRFGIDGSRRWRGRRQPTRERCKAMYGREGEEKKRQRHMRPALTPGSIATEAAAPLAFPYVNPLDSFSKGAHKSHVGECALFQSGNTLPFVEIIRWFTRGKEDCLKLCVNWLYRPTDIKLAKDILLDNFPNEVLYSFHKDAITAASLLHPCKVAFLEKGVELPSWISSFLCRRVYDIANKRLWWLTDQEYINKHQEEVDKLLNKTRLEMHAAVQSGSQKSQSTSASTLELKSGSDRVQNSDTSFPSQAKGKKRLGDQGEELVKGDQDMGAVKRDQGTELINQQHPAKLDDGDYVYFEFDNMKAEIAKITEKGGLISYEGVEKLVNLMQLGRTKKKVDLAGRIILADVIAATDKYDCLDKFVQLMGVSVLDDWLQEVHKGKPSDGRRHRDSDKVVEDFLLSLLQALDKLPVNLNALQTCNIGKSVNNLRTHKNLEIQKKARSLVDTWKKRVNAEISKTNDAKSVGSGRPVSCSVKPCSSDVSHSGNKRSGSTNVAAKMHSTQPSACRALSNKYGAPDSPKKENFPASIVVSLKDSHCKTVEEKSSGSSQSQNNSDQAKTMASSWKQEVRSSTAGSTTTSKLAGGSYHHRRSSNALLGTSIAACQRENHLGRSGSVNKVMTLEKASQRGQTSERPTDVPVDDHGNTNSLIVRLPTHGWSHRRSASGDSFEDPLVMSSRSSSPGIPDKQHHNNHKRQKNDVSQSHIATDANTVPLQHNDVKEDAGAEGVISPTDILDEEHGKFVGGSGKVADTIITACLSSGNENVVSLTRPRRRNSCSSIHALIESCAKYSEASTPLAVRDDMGMNLPATVAAGEISKSDLISSTDSLGTSPVAEVPSNGNGESKLGSSCDDNMAKRNIQYDEAADANSEKEGKSIGSVLAMEPLQQVNTNFTSNSSNAIRLQDNKLTNDPMTQSTVSCMSSHKIVDSCMKVEVKIGEERIYKCISSSKPAEVEECDADGAFLLKDKRMTGGQVSDIYTDGKPNSTSSSMDENKFLECECEKIGDGSICTSDIKIGYRCDLDISASGRNLEKLHVEKKTSSIVVKEVSGGTNSIDQQQALSSDAVDESVNAVVLLAADNVPSPKAADESRNRKLGNSGINHLESGHEGNEPNCIPVSSIVEPVGSTVVSLVTAQIVGNLKEAHENCPLGSASQEPPSTLGTEETEHSAKSISSKISAFDSDGRKALASSAEPCSVIASAELDVATKLEFDLNEDLPADDENDGQPAVSAAASSSTVHLPNLSSSANFMSNCLPTSSITVSAPAKGPFVPPESLLKTKGELGWKGSAATSAFRPAEPLKTLEMTPNDSDVSSFDGAGKLGQPPLGIDLNIADERVAKDMASQTWPLSVESGQFLASTSCRLEMPLLPGRPASEANMLRNFDLNDRPSPSEVGVEPVQRNQQARDVPFLAPVTDHRTSNSVSSWFHPNSYPAVAVPSFLYDRREQSNQIVGALGSRRILGSVIGGGNLGNDIYRGPVLSSSPAMACSPAAAFSYGSFPLASSFPIASTSFRDTSTQCVDLSSGGGSCFPTFPSMPLGPSSGTSSHYPRPYLISFPEGRTASVSDNSLIWSRQVLDLNTGSGSGKMEGKGERLPSASKPLLAATSQAFMEEQTRMCGLSGVGSKRKEPEGSWDVDRSAKQYSR